VIVDFGMWVYQHCEQIRFSSVVSSFRSAKHLQSPEEQLHSLAGSFGYVAPEVLSNLGHGKAVDMWSTGWVASSSCPYWLLMLCGHTQCRIITYVLLCGYSPFRSEDVKLLIKETMEAHIEFHDQYWRKVSVEGAVSSVIENGYINK